MSLTAGDVTVVVPAGAPAGAYELTVTNVTKTTDANDDTTIKANIELTNNGAAVSSDYEYTVIINADIMSQDIEVHHGEELVSNPTYDVFTGKVSFKTRSFSPFSVDYNIFGTEVVLDGRTIKSGFFKGVNPATLDANLLGDASEYIAVDYTKDSVDYYAVSERATTIIVGDADNGGQGYAFENGNYAVKMINNNDLYKIVTNSQNIIGYVPETVYILPGTYVETTTVNIHTNMDIIGLGVTENIKLIKGAKASYSNRHLINVNGSVDRDKHIEVTIRGLYLEAIEKCQTSKTSNSYTLDNGSVQSIRLSKVKCYDLIINDNDFPFYVNAKYDPRGALCMSRIQL